MRDQLIQKIRSLTEQDDRSPPVVALDEYFAGNDQEDSIAPNQVGYGRPPLAELYARLQAIAARPEVQTVLVSIHEDWVDALEYEDIWPAGDCVHIYTSAPKAQVEAWIAGLAADGVLKGWPRKAHRAAPEPLRGYAVYTVVWD